MLIDLTPETAAQLETLAEADGVAPELWLQMRVAEWVRKAHWSYRTQHPQEKAPKRSVGRPRLTLAEKEGRRSLDFFEELWAFWRGHLGERWEALAGPLYRQWQRHVEQQDWAWLARFKEAQPWQQLQGRMAGKEWEEQ